MAEMPSHTAHGECLHSGIPLQRWAERCLEWEACRFPKQYSQSSNATGRFYCSYTRLPAGDLVILLAAKIFESHITSRQNRSKHWVLGSCGHHSLRIGIYL